MKRGRWFGNVPVSREHVGLEDCIRLWRAVLDQALEDFLYPEVSYEGVSAKLRAKVWLRGNSRDFLDVCSLAELDPAGVRKRIEEVVGGRDKLD